MVSEHRLSGGTRDENGASPEQGVPRHGPVADASSENHPKFPRPVRLALLLGLTLALWGGIFALVHWLR